MRNYYLKFFLIPTLIVLGISCSENRKPQILESKSELLDSVSSEQKGYTENVEDEKVEEISEDILTNRNEWKFDSINMVKVKSFSNEMDISRFDTVLNDGIKISIIPKYLDSYVTQEWNQEDTLYRIKYYDLAYRLKLEKEGGLLLDSTFTKLAFIEEPDSSFANIALFHGYWFNQFQDKEIVIFGNICKPDTDWCLFFNHRINTETGEIGFVIPEPEDEI